ncbi:MAG: cardiolipin synthase [Peptostreptococcaceae bacterium]|nr:cardiolipin synthase [Peptostreptococcaceae bacterium]
MANSFQYNVKQGRRKNMKKLSRIIFGRTVIILSLFAIQIAIMLALFLWMSEYINYIYGGFTLLSLLTIVYIINSPSNPNFKLAWIVPILVIPIFGTLFYIYAQMEFGTKMIVSSLKTIRAKTNHLLVQDEDALKEVAERDPDIARVAKYLMNTGKFPIYKNSTAKYFPIGEEAFEEMVKQLKEAKHFIFMEYFIIESGIMLDTVVGILEQKVREGVEVRFMYDGMVSLAQMPNSYTDELEKMGINAKQFSPIKPILSTSYNNRDHRKIMVIDGRVAFTGGINLADEYINKKKRFGHWKDNAIMVKGDAVRSFTLMFLQMWNVDENIPEDYERYLRMPHGNTHCDGYMMPYGDDPFDYENVGENLYIDMIANAKEYVHIMTPYLILDDSMVNAMSFAAKSGIDVVVMMPHIPDKWYAYALARTYYEELIRAGVKIYEYTPGFVHSKVFVSDGMKATVGTVNLDYRSLYLHFECGVYLYGSEAVKEVEWDFKETLKRCHLITLEEAANFGLLQKIIGRFVLRLFAPLL